MFLLIMKSPEIQQFNKSEIVSSKMYSVAEKVGAQRPDLHQTFSRAANEFSTESYDKGQRILEEKGAWSDEVRGVASEANQVAREKVGAKPLSFDDARSAISGYAKNLAESGTLDDRKGAAMIESIVAGMNRPGQTGIDGIEEVLKYVEGVLQTKSTSERQVTPQMKKEWDEQRAVRDALLAEKQKRMDKMKQAQRVNEGSANDQNRTSQTLEALYASAGIPEETPSRQQLLQRVKNMSPEELHFFSGELNNIQKKFNETGNLKDLDASLFELTTKKYTKEEIHKRQGQKDEEELKRVRNFLNGEKPKEDEMPENSRELTRFHKDNFGKFENLSLEAFRRDFTPDIKNNFKSWISQHLKILIREKSSAGMYPDTVASVLGNDPAILIRIASIQDGRVLDSDELLKMPFSEAAKKYLDIELPEDYFDNFRRK